MHTTVFFDHHWGFRWAHLERVQQLTQVDEATQMSHGIEGCLQLLKSPPSKAFQCVRSQRVCMKKSKHNTYERLSAMVDTSNPWRDNVDEDNAVLGQFCAKVITYCLYSFIYSSCRVSIKNLMRCSLIMYFTLFHSNVSHSPLERLAQLDVSYHLSLRFYDMNKSVVTIGNVWSFNPCSFLLSIATDDRKQFQCLNIVLNNKTGPSFLEFKWCQATL